MYIYVWCDIEVTINMGNLYSQKFCVIVSESARYVWNVTNSVVWLGIGLESSLGCLIYTADNLLILNNHHRFNSR